MKKTFFVILTILILIPTIFYIVFKIEESAYHQQKFLEYEKSFNNIALKMIELSRNNDELLVEYRESDNDFFIISNNDFEIINKIEANDYDKICLKELNSIGIINIRYDENKNIIYHSYGNYYGFVYIAGDMSIDMFDNNYSFFENSNCFELSSNWYLFASSIYSFW